MKNQFADASNMDVQEIERQRDTWRAAYEQARRELEAVKAAGRAYFEHQYWRGYGERLAALVDWQPPCADAREKADG